MPPQSTAATRNNTEGRLSALEQGHLQLHEDLKGLRMDFAQHSRDIQAVLGELRRTPWGDLWKGAAVFLTVVGLVGTLVTYAINTRTDSVEDAALRAELRSEKLSDRVRAVEIGLARLGDR